MTCLTLYDLFFRAGHALISLSGGHVRFGANAANGGRSMETHTHGMKSKAILLALGPQLGDEVKGVLTRY